MKNKKKYKSRVTSIKSYNKVESRDRNDINLEFSRDNIYENFFGRSKISNRDEGF